MTKLLLHLTTITSILLSIGCSTLNSDRIYKGKYFYHFEASTFTPYGSSEGWCVAANEMKEAQLPVNEAPSPFGGSWGSADVVVRGELSPPGRYCSMGASRYILKVNKILEVKNMKAGDPQHVPN